MAQLNAGDWVKEQYRTPDNLSARVQLHRRFSTNPESWFAWVYDRLQVAAGQRILEVGGGHGLLWHENAARLPAGVRVTITDLSPGMVAQAAGALSGQPAFDFAQADAQHLPFATGVFDTVVANHMLYHVPDRDQALREIHRVLRPGGRLLAATNDVDHLREIGELAAAYSPAAAQQLPVANHRLFSFDIALAEASRAFGQVQLHRYANDLVVTDADALADYMLSGLPMNVPSDEQPRFRAWLHAQMSARSQIVIRSATGLIEANDALS